MRRNRLAVAAQCVAGIVAAIVTSSGASAQVEIAVGEALDLHDFTLQYLTVPQELGPHAQINVEIDGVVRTMTLFRHSMRGQNFRVVTSDGREVEAPPVHTYKGMLHGVRGSRVAASLYEGQLNAHIMIGDETWGIQPASDADSNAEDDLHVVYHMADARPGDWSCGVIDEVGHDHDHGHDVVAGGDGTKICEISFDCDWEYYVSEGQSIPNTISDLEFVMSGVGNVYSNQVDIVYEIGTIIVRDNPNDPYTTSDSSALLNQFRNEWRTTQSGVHRDVAHLMTARNLNGGIIGVAFLNGICNVVLQYGLSETKFTLNNAFRVGLTAHELGHNWSANHCDGQGDCGTMCSGIGGCPGSVTVFGNASRNAITNFANFVGCLEFVPDDMAIWDAQVTTTNGDDEYQVGETATLTFSIDFEPDVDGTSIIGLAATIVDIIGDNGASLGEVTGWQILNQLEDLTGDLTELDGADLTNINAGQLTQFGPFTDDDPIDVIEFTWETEQVGPYDVGYETVTESMVVWEREGNDDFGIDWAVVEADISFEVIPGQACEADCTQDGQLNVLDFVCFQAFWTEQEPFGDCNDDGVYNVLDFVCFQQKFVAGCP